MLREITPDNTNYTKEQISEYSFSVEGEWTQKWMKIPDLQSKQIPEYPEIKFKQITQDNISGQQLLDLFNNVGRNFNWGCSKICQNEKEFLEYFLGNPKECITLQPHVQDNEASLGLVQYFIEEKTNSIYIAFFGLKKDFQGQGLGPKVMQTILKQFQEQKYASVSLFTDNHDSPWAFKFYQKQGYEHADTKVQKSKRYYQDKF